MKAAKIIEEDRIVDIPYEEAEVTPEPSDQTTQAIVKIQKEAKDIIIANQADLTEANNLLVMGKALWQKIDEEFDPGIHQAHEHHKYLVEQKRRFTQPLADAAAILKPKIANFIQEQKRQRLEAERAAELARRKAEVEAYQASDKAHELIDNGQIDEADKVIEKSAAKIEAIQAAAPVVPEKVEAPGTSLRQIWTFEILDEERLKREAPEFTVPDMVKIRGYARAMKEQGKIPGVRIYAETTVATKVRGI